MTLTYLGIFSVVFITVTRRY